MLKVGKFGGSSLADASRFLRVRQIVTNDVARRVVVVSAPGKRHAGDQKITDLLYLCHAHLRYGVSCWDIWRRICDRYLSIRDGCGLHYPIERELEELYASFSAQTELDRLVSRGEYLAARLMAELLEFQFVDAAEWLRFDYDGQVRKEESYALLGSLADGRKIVTPGFYGTLPDGRIHTFPRGGADVSGALAAAALRSDVYENWTDVAGILAADPRIVCGKAAAIPRLSFEELEMLTKVGMQVLHERAVAPVRERQIPIQIRSTFQPDLPGTIISARNDDSGGTAGFAGRRRMAMLRICGTRPGAAETALRQIAAEPFCVAAALGQTTALLDMDGGSEMAALAAQLRKRLPEGEVTLRENLAVLAAICRTSDCIPPILAAVEAAGVPVHHLLRCAPGLLMVVNDSQYETALCAAAATLRQA